MDELVAKVQRNQAAVSKRQVRQQIKGSRRESAAAGGRARTGIPTMTAPSSRKTGEMLSLTVAGSVLSIVRPLPPVPGFQT